MAPVTGGVAGPLNRKGTGSTAMLEARAEFMLKIASWNVNSLPVRLDHVLQWLAQNGPDILAMQECKVADDAFPHAAFQDAGYQALCAGQKGYNGVAMAARQRGTEVVVDLPGYPDPARRLLTASFGRLRVMNLYVPNGQAVGTEKYRYKLDWLEALVDCVRVELSRHPHLVIVGDFNIAPDDRDLYHPELLAGGIMSSAPEREAFDRLLALGCVDTFRLFEQPPETYTWWDYRLGAFRHNRGMRIDHILASASLAARCRASYVDKAPRGWERPSDHAVVVAEFDWG